MNGYEMEKVAEYRDEIEKLASRAWKRNLGKVGKQGVKKLIDSGVLDRKKELKGLRKGTAAILGKEKSKMYRKSEHAASHVTKSSFDRAKKQGIPVDIEERVNLKNQLKAMGSFGAPDNPIKGVKGTGVTYVRKGAHNEISSALNKQIKEVNKHGDGPKVKELKKIPRRDGESKKWVQSILERHEADEVRMGRRVLKNKKKTINIEGVNHPTTTFGSHNTPKVLMAESANVALAPKKAQDRMKHLRNWNAKLHGNDATEMGAIKNLSHGKFQYGKGATFDKKTAKKVENGANRITREGYKEMGLL